MKDQRVPYKKIIEMCKNAVEKVSDFKIKAFDKRNYVEDGSSYELFLISRTSAIRGRPFVFVVAGFHGEEPAGPMAVVRGIGSWLRFAEKNQLNLSVIPCANPWGYDRSVRNTPATVFTNGGFAHKTDRISPEFLALKNVLHDGKIEYYIDLHEDDTDPKGAYVYAFGDKEIAKEVLAAMTSQDIPLDPKPSTDDPEVIPHLIGEGLVYDLHDGTSEDLVSHKEECVVAIAPETPSNSFPLLVRASAHMRGVEALLKIAKMRSAQ